MANKNKNGFKEIEAWFESLIDSRKISKATSEMKKNTQTAISSFANRFDLITRDEFKVQQTMLAEAVKKLDALEKLLAKQGVISKPASKKAKPAKASKRATKKRAPKKTD